VLILPRMTSHGEQVSGGEIAHVADSHEYLVPRFFLLDTDLRITLPLGDFLVFAGVVVHSERRVLVLVRGGVGYPQYGGLRIFEIEILENVGASLDLLDHAPGFEVLAFAAILLGRRKVGNFVVTGDGVM